MEDTAVVALQVVLKIYGATDPDLWNDIYSPVMLQTLCTKQSHKSSTKQIGEQ